jgi:class 3 adenylate cyclase
VGIGAPDIHYARSRGASLAYQIVGEGPIDIVELAGIFTHLEAKWEEPGLVRSTLDLGRFARVILFDRRGIGLSDRLASEVAPSLDELVEDTRAVMDAAGSEQAVMLGTADGAATAVAFAAAHPERVRALVLYCMSTLVPVGDEMLREIESTLAIVEREWGTGAMARVMRDESLKTYFARVERRACTPRAALSMLMAMAAMDLSALLPTLRVPALILHYRDHPLPVESARRAAALVPGARYVELDGYSADAQVRERRGLASAIEEFLTGSATVSDRDRVLAAVLFTDIVGSTERAAQLGDLRWRDLLDEHDRRVRQAVEAGGGRIIKSTGDGALALFDGAARAVRSAQALCADAKRLGVPIRAGIHVGECDARGDDVGGMAVHVAARVMALARANEVLVTSTLREALVGSGIRFESRGLKKLRGVPGEWHVYIAA